MSSYCNKNCSICSRSVEQKHEDIHMSRETFHNFANNLDSGIMISCHGRGESSCNPLFDEFVIYLKSLGMFLVIDTNAINLNLNVGFKKFDTITVSTFKDDVIWKSQLENMNKFLLNPCHPRLLIRINGDVGEERDSMYRKLVGDMNIVYRDLHSVNGSVDYSTNKPIIPEHGMCLELLNHPVVWADGSVSTCIRWDKDKKRVIGNVNEQPMKSIMVNPKRIQMIKEHILMGTSKYCKDCEYRGIPVVSR